MLQVAYAFWITAYTVPSINISSYTYKYILHRYTKRRRKFREIINPLVWLFEYIVP